MKGLLIDLGGTLLDNSGYDFKNAFYKVCDLVQTSKDYNNLYEEFMKRYNEESLKAKSVLSEFQIGFLLSTFFNNENKELLEECFFNELTINEGLIDNAEKLLSYYKGKGYVIIALSNSCFSSRALSLGLDRLNILKYFDNVISSSDIFVRKPNPKMFHYAIRKMRDFGVDKENIIFIGNSFDCDIIGGTNNKIKTMWYIPTSKIDDKCRYEKVKDSESITAYLSCIIDNYEDIMI